MRPLVSLTTVVVLAVFQPPLRGDDESVDAYEISATTAVSILPPPLRAFFQARIEPLMQIATAGIAGTSKVDALPGTREWHYIMLDVAAGDDDPTVRHVAARSFPRDRAAATALFKRYGRSNGGSLLWIVEERCKALTGAFRGGKTDDILRAAGVLLHFATDAALPFNTTRDRNGVAPGNLQWSARGRKNITEGMHRTVRHRLQLALLRRIRVRLDYEVRVFPQRYAAVTDPSRATHQTLLEAHAALAPLLDIDAAATAELGLVDASSFTSAKEAFYARISARAGSIMASRLEAGALLAANLIGTAWVDAGTPPPDEWVGGGAPVAIRRQPNGKASAPFVGSRNSTIFHRSACSHARRIKPANRVYFDTPVSAHQAGRIPCKSCRPGETEPH